MGAINNTQKKSQQKNAHKYISSSFFSEKNPMMWISIEMCCPHDSKQGIDDSKQRGGADELGFQQTQEIASKNSNAFITLLKPKKFGISQTGAWQRRSPPLRR